MERWTPSVKMKEGSIEAAVQTHSRRHELSTCYSLKTFRGSYQLHFHGLSLERILAALWKGIVYETVTTQSKTNTLKGITSSPHVCLWKTDITLRVDGKEKRRIPRWRFTMLSSPDRFRWDPSSFVSNNQASRRAGDNNAGSKPSNYRNKEVILDGNGFQYILMRKPLRGYEGVICSESMSYWPSVRLCVSI